MSDFGFIIKNEIERGWDQKCIIFDLPRNHKDRDTIFEALECMKDGIFTSYKYQSTRCRMSRKPVTIVFANWWPDFRKSSQDRWKCYYIHNRDCCKEISLEETKKQYLQHQNITDTEEGEDGVCSM